MPHYKDGTPAEVGDLVKGKPYNTSREVVGTLVQITEGTDSCNCIVAFADAKVTTIPLHIFSQDGLQAPLHVRRPTGGRILFNQVQPEYENVLISARYDYGEVGAFTKIG